MTPRAFLARLDALLAEGRYQAILDLAERVGAEVFPRLSARDMESVVGVLEQCAMAVEFAATEKAHEPAPSLERS
jgi:hypothetical protein